MESSALILLALLPAQPTWTHAGGSSARNSLASHPLPNITQPLWSRSTDASNNPITFRYQSTPLVSQSLIFVLGSVRPSGSTQDIFKCFALRRSDGAVAWSAQVPTPNAALGSQSSPALSEKLGVLYVPSNNAITALRASDGVQLWQTTLPRTIVNASPCLTDDLSADRLFITDYDFDAGGAPGSLHCINISPASSTNPYTPGQLLWSFPIQGLSGNSPAYLPHRKGGPRGDSCQPLIFVATSGSPDITPGDILALPATATTTPTPVWQRSNTIPQGFFGGVSLAPGPRGHVELLASSYAFFDLANTLRIDAATGTLLADIPTNRSAATPIALQCVSGGGVTRSEILLSTGYDGFGSIPTLELLARDDTAPNTLSMLWDSWTAASLRVAGWNHQPAATLSRVRHSAAVGTIAANANTLAGQNLKIIDLTQPPTSPGFVIQSTTQAGGSVALAGLNLYSIGTAGLCAFGPAWTNADIDASARITAADLYQWETNWQMNAGPRDVDGDTHHTLTDREVLMDWLRSDERAILTEVRP